MAVVSDLMFQSRLREQARALGYESAIAGTTPSLRDGLAGAPALLVIDLHVAGLLPSDMRLVARRPFRAPHHTISHAGLVGGGRTRAPARSRLAMPASINIPRDG